MNSFRFIERGIEAELERQRALLEAGEAVTQDTLHFDPRTGELTPLRSKEYAHDYRYFPEPDLVPLAPTEAMLADARAALPELPEGRRERYLSELGLSEKLATLIAFDAELAQYFEAALATDAGVAPTALANWITGELVARLREADGADPASSRVEPAAIARLAGMVEAKEISSGAARQVLAKLVAEGGDPAEVAEREGLAGVEDHGELAEIVARALESDPAAAEQVKRGNMRAVGPLVGFVMRETKGRADGGEVTRLIREQLGL
jgi:aspartyl-tRNA(Asn)/glutamyl-tRNA(Gln) amidotransferase subunit B